MNLQRWISVGVILLLIVLVIGLVLPAIQATREDARQVNSRNHLKQIGEALMSYHQTEGCLPPGGVMGENDVPLQGWMAQILPHSSSAVLYTLLKQNEAWDSQENWPWFQVPVSEYLIPGEQLRFTVEGYGLTHYLGNPHLFYRNNAVTFAEMKNGTAHTWVSGEVAGQYQPWSYPFNWRPLGAKLCEGPDSFGYPPWKAGHLLFADGSVSLFTEQTSDVILKKFAAAPPVPTEEQTAVPDKTFVTGNFEWEVKPLQSDSKAELVYQVKSLVNSEKIPVLIQVFSMVRPLEEKEIYKRMKEKDDQRRDEEPRRPMPKLLFSITSQTDIPQAVKESPLPEVTTPEQRESNLKLLQSLQSRLPE